MKGLTETETRILTDILAWQKDLMVMEKERKNIDGMSCRIIVTFVAPEHRWASFNIFDYENKILHQWSVNLMTASYDEAVRVYNEMLEEYEKAK